MNRFFAFGIVAILYLPSFDFTATSCGLKEARRLLNRLEDDGWSDVLQSCSEVQYETSIYVHKHIFVVSTPVVKGDSGCPSIAMEQSGALGKPSDADSDALTDSEIRTVNVHEVILPNYIDPKSFPYLPLGTFLLKEIAKAFHNAKAQVLSDPDSMQNFDIVTENCGHFPNRMMDLLNVEIDHEMVRFIASRLQKTNPALAQDVRKSPSATKLLSDRSRLDDLTDLQLIELNVEFKVKHLYNSSTAPLSDIYNNKLPKEEGRRRRILSTEEEETVTLKTDRRLSETKCGRWYSSRCLAESDIRYDPTASNAIADQNPLWKKLEGLYEASATAYGPDGRAIEPSFLKENAVSFSPDQMPYTQAPYKMFINITLSGSRMYEQMHAIYPPPPSAFCTQPIPEGMLNVILPGQCGLSGTSGFYERFGTSTFEKDGSLAMLPFGSTMTGVKLDRKSYVSLPAGESNHFSSYMEGDLLVQYASACLDAECSQLSTTIDYYVTSIPEGEEFKVVASTRMLAKRITSSEDFHDALEQAYFENNVPPDQRPFKGDCLSGYCPDKSDWCEYDPECAVSPYQEPEASILIGPIAGIGLAVFVVIFSALFYFHRSQMKQKEAVLRAKFAGRIAEGIRVNGNAGSLSPDELASEFHKIDQDKGGALEKEELWAFLQSGRVGHMSRADFDMLFSVIDIDRSGNVDFNEFVAFFAKCDMNQT
ncbi:unnamed protein product [Cylindrotheca closterium]|uniref:EF-hand domain-containing protein n=1 Tax=Cylindrotheca closterium TaxID=2856 RepID=A0AAD2GBD7_9STRA|nr:unnamed protein product [Cylindrotheca closterium]